MSLTQSLKKCLVVIKASFLGFVAPEELVLKNPSWSIADNRMQIQYCNLLKKIFDEVRIVTVPPFKFDREMLVSTLGDGFTAAESPFPTNSLLDRVAKNVSALSNLYRWAKAEGSLEANLVLFVFHTSGASLAIATILKALKPGLKVITIAIVPFEGLVEISKRDYFHRVVLSFKRGLLRTSSAVISITKPLGQNLLPSKPLLVINGGVNNYVRPGNVHFKKKGGKKTVVYAGNLSRRYSLVQLAEAFSMISHGQYELHFYGTGELEDVIRLQFSATKNIYLHEPVAENEIRQVLETADLVAVLLENETSASENSFPSKIFEAIGSGAQVMATNLKSFSPEMKSVIHTVPSTEPHVLAKSMLQILNLPDTVIRRRREQAHEYMSGHGQWGALEERLSEFVEAVVNDGQK